MAQAAPQAAPMAQAYPPQAAPQAYPPQAGNPPPQALPQKAFAPQPAFAPQQAPPQAFPQQAFAPQAQPAFAPQAQPAFAPQPGMAVAPAYARQGSQGQVAQAYPPQGQVAPAYMKQGSQGRVAQAYPPQGQVAQAYPPQGQVAQAYAPGPPQATAMAGQAIFAQAMAPAGPPQSQCRGCGQPFTPRPQDKGSAQVRSMHLCVSILCPLPHQLCFCHHSISGAGGAADSRLPASFKRSWTRRQKRRCSGRQRGAGARRPRATQGTRSRPWDLEMQQGAAGSSLPDTPRVWQSRAPAPGPPPPPHLRGRSPSESAGLTRSSWIGRGSRHSGSQLEPRA
jgi:hypothetical protein